MEDRLVDRIACLKHNGVMFRKEKCAHGTPMKLPEGPADWSYLQKRLIIEIELDNETMSQYENVVQTLHEIAAIFNEVGARELGLPASGNIRDLERKVVGFWKVLED